MEDQKTLLESLTRPGVLPGSGENVECIETHANWILLAGQRAWKIKKAVDLGFLDFSTLERRAHFCREELRLNRRLAPDLYLEVATIHGSPEAPGFGESGNPIEYAVVMRRMDPDQRLDRRLERGELARDELDPLARDIAAFHRDLVPADPDSTHGRPDQLRGFMEDNFRVCGEHLSGEDAKRLAGICSRGRRLFDRLEPRLDQRRQEGHVRECHGDLHLGNLIRHEGRVRAFDCIEFDPELRWVDTASEISFLLMDLRFRGRADLAARWLDRYLEWTGDHAAWPLLSHYQSYLAMVRCKVALLAAAQHGHESTAGRKQRDQARRYLETAGRALAPGRGCIILTHGLSGSGKSHVSGELLEQLDALRLRSDIERKRLFGLEPLDRSHSQTGAGLYTAGATEKTFDHLCEKAAGLAGAGCRVIVDATFLRRDLRDRFRRAASSRGLAFAILHVDAPRAVLESRVSARNSEGRDASEAGLEVLADQIRHMEPLDDPERALSLRVDTSEPVDAAVLARQLVSRLELDKTA